MKADTGLHGQPPRRCHGQLHVAHWLVLFCSAFLTVFVWHASEQATEERLSLRFERRTDQIAHLLIERLEKYEVALQSGAAMLDMLHHQVSFRQWRRFSDSLHMTERYPGINGIGVIDRVNAADRTQFIKRIREQGKPGFRIHPEPDPDKESLVITYIQPESTNKEAVGLDVAFEESRRNAAYLARDTAQATISAPITLVQDSTRQPGFLQFVPVYDTSGMLTSPENWTKAERRERIRRFVYAPFVVGNLMQGALASKLRLISVKVSDGETTLYAEEELDDQASSETLQRTLGIPLYGRQWQIEFKASDKFEQAYDSNESTVILVIGILVELLLLLLFLSMAKANRQMSELTSQLSESNVALERRRQELKVINEDLESFAYIASHDLKTPLRGIHFLTELIDEEIEKAKDTKAIDEEAITYNVQRIANQAARLDVLINDIMDYCSIDGSKEAIESVSLLKEIELICETLQIERERVRIEADVDSIMTGRTQFVQVLSNLIGNAVKHHHQPEKLVIDVQLRQLPDCYKLSITDNGPGIDARFHERIFNVFESLQSNEGSDSTGIGLAIVSKCAERQGGEVQLISEPGKGSTFVVRWPLGAKSASLLPQAA